ncbi:YbdD/YjiX family protein [Sphingomonas sp. S1-29]|uniref:YbdD/YjiX family protein n=1 Tax=Sphingomonas sp. S1-29 TaxID=2991074 RepID=UPI00223F0FFC|nr:YbdD/YjiX family protein [Sphingomonas sp. S1-29]UZK68460.1 YbdD/YjiX family protein [Sphingomonas sp. S1-29]
MSRLLKGWRVAAKTARLMVGVPDYDGYVAHRAALHPGEPVMTLAEFHRNRIDRRYGTGPGSTPRCC